MAFRIPHCFARDSNSVFRVSNRDAAGQRNGCRQEDQLQAAWLSVLLSAKGEGSEFDHLSRHRKWKDLHLDHALQGCRISHFAFWFKLHRFSSPRSLIRFLLLFTQFGRQIRQDKKKAVFLSPTVVLAQQQSQEIMRHTNFRVKAFYGELGVDAWTSDEWADEIESVDILVLTPDLFYRIVTKQYIDGERICVLVFDECHHAGLKIKPGSKCM